MGTQNIRRKEGENLTQGGESSRFNTVWRLVRGGIGGENSELQLVHWGTNCMILFNFAPFLQKSTNILENKNI